MSDDENVAKDLVQTLQDGRKGFAAAADRLRDGEHPQWAATLTGFADQRAAFASRIVEMGHEYGDDVEENGSLVAGLHRGWLSLKDALSGDDPSGVLDAAVSGEDHSVSEYDTALGKDLSEGFRSVVQEQRDAVVAAREELKALSSAS